MKVLMLNGSPHDSGVNDLALREMEAVFKESGVETETVQVGNLAVRGCSACGACTKLGMEVFGYQYFPFFFVVCAIAYIVNQNESIYALQRQVRE